MCIGLLRLKTCYTHSSKAAILPGKAKAILKRMNLLMSSGLLADGRITFDLSN